MARRKVKTKPSFLVQPDPIIDAKYSKQKFDDINKEIEKCKNGLEGLKYFINEYLYVPNKIKPEILIDKPKQFKHIIFEKEKINLKLYDRQIEYLDTLFSSRLTAAYKSRQCLPEGSIIYTPKGPKEIQDLVVGDEIYSFNEEARKIEIDIVDDVQQSGIRHCRIMKTVDGNRTIQGENHPFLLESGEQKKCKDIAIEDILIQNIGNFGDISVNDYEAKLLAQFITDGKTTKQPRFTNTNWDYIIDVSNSISQFDSDLIISIRERDNKNKNQLPSQDLYPHMKHGANRKNSFHKFLIKFGIYGCTSVNKVLPEEVFNQNKQSIAILLNRCFAGDGWFTKAKSGNRINGCKIGFGTESRKLVYQLKQLLWNFGINAKIKTAIEKGGTGKPFYKLIISHRENIKKFYDEIGIFGKPFDYEYQHKTKSSLKKVNKNEEYVDLMCYDISVKKNQNFIFEGNVVHNTGISTITQAYVLWYAIFNENKEIVIISKTEAEAIKFLDSIYYMFNHLPFFLRRQYSKAVKKSFHLGSLNTATKINVLTSTSKSGRSFSATILILDEAEFIEHVDDLQAAAQPTLSATGGQAICISTPQLYKSWFWKICHSEIDEAFKIFKISWEDIPGRDKEWYDNQCAELHHDKMKIMTELDMKWIIPFQRYYSEEFMINDYVLKAKFTSEYHKELGLNELPEQFKKIQEDYGLSLILYPKDGMEYYFGIDTFEGGSDHNAGIILGKDMRIYSYFKTKRLDILEMVKQLCDYYKTKICLERNRGFQLIKEFQSLDQHKKYLLFKANKKKNVQHEEFGYLINGENRKRLIGTTAEYLKHVYAQNNEIDYEDRIVLPEALMDEMNYFVIKKSRIEGVENDDLIFALIGSLYAKDNKNTFFNWKDQAPSSDMLKKAGDFYGEVNKAKQNPLLANGKVNTLLARGFMSGISSNKSLTVDQLNMLDQVLVMGKQLVDERLKADSEKLNSVR